MDILLKLYETIDIGIISRMLAFYIYAYIDVKTFTLLFKTEIDKKDKVKIIISMGTLKAITTIIIPNPYYVVVNIIIGITIFKIILKKNIEKCVLGEAINGIILICGKAVISKFFLMANTTRDANTICYCIFSASMSILTIVTYIVMKKLKIEINLSDDLSKKNKISIMIISIIGCIVIHFNVAEVTLFIPDFPYFIFLLSVIASIVCFYTSISDIVRLDELEKKDIKIQCLENYNNTLSILYDNMRVFKHDFFNFVQALDGYAQTDNIEGIKKMTNSILKDCKSINTMEVLDPRIINNPAIYSIITNKYYLAKKQNINMNVEVMINIAEINISTYNLCKILGILLDNAIEAAKECDEKIVNIKFIRDYSCDRKLIIIENTYNKVDIDIDKIFEKGYSTKIDNNNEHGLGLWTIRKMLEQSNNLNLFTMKEKLFKQQLEIY